MCLIYSAVRGQKRAFDVHSGNVDNPANAYEPVYR